MSSSFPLQPGTVLCDRYILQEAVHSGHWSLTIRAQQQANGQTVILKLPGPGNSASGVSIAFHAAWMQRVFHSLSQLHHPNRASVLDYLEAHGLPILVQQEVLGIPMSQRLAHKPLPEQEAIALIRKVALALSGVHGKGLIHRDVRPENVIYRSGVQQPVLIDWGLQPSVFPANRASSYAAPEQFQPGGQFQPSIDVYGLAATLYALVTGQPPLHASLRQQSNLELPRQLQPHLSAALERAILCGMELNPQSRPPSMGAWMGLLPEAAPVSSGPVSSNRGASSFGIDIPRAFPPQPNTVVAQAANSPKSTANSSTVSSASPTPSSTSPTVAVATVPGSSRTIDLEPTDLKSTSTASPPLTPMKTLLMLSCAATLFGASMGLVLRITNPVSVAGISALGRPQSFPEEEWPGSKTFGDLPLDVPPPEQGFSNWGEDSRASSSWEDEVDTAGVERLNEQSDELPREWVAPVDDDPPMPQPLPREEFAPGDRSQQLDLSDGSRGDRWGASDSADSNSSDYYEPPHSSSSRNDETYSSEPAPTPVETLDNWPEADSSVYEDSDDSGSTSEPALLPDQSTSGDPGESAYPDYEGANSYEESSPLPPAYEDSYQEEPVYYEPPFEESFHSEPSSDSSGDSSVLPWEESLATE